ncbi:cell division cycle 20, cofactor of APC complex [Angomonas deanei]|nr:cell division cycle 20, cofactor of APC complex [Angomonas deanei]|eukprot:EPY42936.1 cell division cycle 20, cofactor of APC complex [Angomonas deanei]
MDISFNTPLRGQRPPSFNSPSFHTPQGPHTPTPSDRFISTRNSQDSTLSHYLLTSKENMTPVSTFGNYSPSRESSMASSYASPPHRSTNDSMTSRGESSSRAESPGGVSSVFAKLRLDNSTSHPNTSPSGSVHSPLGKDVEPYTNKLAKALFSDAPHTSVLNIQPVNSAFHYQNSEKSPYGPSSPYREEVRFNSSLGVVYELNRARNFRSKNFRVIAQTPERILDAADIIDDFYLNLVDWSSTDLLCVALQSAVYLWEASSSSITQLPTTRPADSPGSVVCGVSWAPDGRHLSIGLHDGTTEVWDVEAQTVVHSWQEHRGRVGSLNWSCTGDVLASGGKDTTIRMHDMRQRTNTQVLRGHQQEVCGLRWSPSGHLLASGGNDNQLLVWDRRMIENSTGSSRPQLYLNQHTAAVKAISWNPVQTSLLVSGGGTDDKSLRFWNTSTGECIHHVDTQSQVCGVLWNHAGTELVTSHGFSQNQLTIWKYPSLRRVADLTGHTSRVLHLCLSADGEVVVSAAGDETIRFWRVFQNEEEREASPYCAGYHSRAAKKRGPSAPSCHYDPAIDEVALR